MGTAEGEFASILNLLARDPLAGADRLDALADRLRAQAAHIRAAVAAGGGPTSAGSLTERVQVRVIGPDGRTKQETDTLRN